MTDDQHTLRVPTRIATLRADAGDDGPAVFSGIAVAPGDILRMDDGTRVLFTEEELRAAADTQADEPLTVDHPRDDEGRPTYPPPVEETVGKVPKSGFIEGRGVGYEATTHDDDLAAGIEAGSYEVSVHPEFTLGEQDPETGAYVAENIHFRDLSVVSKGDSPNNTANWGPSQELAAWAHGTDIGSELTGGAGADEPLTRRGLVDVLRNLVASDGEQPDADPAEPGSDADTDDGDSDTSMTDREQQIDTLVENHGFEPEALEPMGDEQIATMHDGLAADGGATPDDPDGDTSTETETDTDTGSDDDNVVRVDIGDHDSVEDYIQSQAEAAVASVSAESEREELIATISSKTDKDEEALAEWPTDALQDKAESLSTPARLPGSTGRRTETVTAAHSGDDDDDLDAYGTGVEGGN